MKAGPPTFVAQVVEETGSTNADLLVAGAAGAPHGTVLRTQHQTAGRGRLDRRWEAPPGTNLLVSILFRRGVERPHRLTQRVAVAAAVACEQVAGVTPDLKWPNDLLLAGRKLAGILAQAGPGLDYVVVGIGLNVGWAPDEGARLGEGVDPGALLEALLAALEASEESETVDEGVHDAAYRRRLSTLGQVVRVTTPAGEVVGEAIDVRADGRLVVRPTGGGRDVSFDTGDVVHVRRVTN